MYFRTVEKLILFLLIMIESVRKPQLILYARETVLVLASLVCRVPRNCWALAPLLTASFCDLAHSLLFQTSLASPIFMFEGSPR